MLLRSVRLRNFRGIRSADLELDATNILISENGVDKAISKTSKPYLAISALQAIAAPDSPGVPRPLRHVIETCVRLARGV